MFLRPLNLSAVLKFVLKFKTVANGKYLLNGLAQFMHPPLFWFGVEYWFIEETPYRPFSSGWGVGMIESK